MALINLGTQTNLANINISNVPVGTSPPTGSPSSASWGNVDAIGNPNLPLAMPCDSNGWRHLYGTRSPGAMATLLYIDPVIKGGTADDETGSPYTIGIGSPMSAPTAWAALTYSFTGPGTMLDEADGWKVWAKGHFQGSPPHAGFAHQHTHIGSAITDIYNDKIARELLQENHPLIFASAATVAHTGGPFGVGLDNPTHEYANQIYAGRQFGPFYVDGDYTTVLKTDRFGTHWNLVQHVIYAVRGEGLATPRNFIGLIKCTEDHNHGSPEVSTYAVQDIPDTAVIVPLSASVTARGGYNPELIFYGGDLHGVQGYANVTSKSITDITITDPGGSVISDVEKLEASITPPQVLLSTPNDSTLFEGFSANVEISTSPEDIQAAYEHLDLAVTNDELNSYFCAAMGGKDPLAQSFLVTDINTVGQGIFVSSVDLCFAAKAKEFSSLTKDPVTVQIRPCTNGGLPARNLVMDCFGRPAEVTLTWDQIVTRDGLHPDQGGNGFPDFENNFTKFTFPVPLFLQPDTYYAIVVLSNDSAYHLWINDITQRLLVDGERAGITEGGGTTSESGRVNHGGTLFKSQNGFTWTEDQNQDMMFRINRCHFGSDAGVLSGSADIHLGNDLDAVYEYDRLDMNLNPGTGTLIPNLNVTTIDKTYHTYSDDSTTLAHSNFVENVVMNMPERKKLRANQPLGDFTVSTSLTTTNRAVSPVIDISQWQLIAYKNFINNGEFQNGDLSANNLINFPTGGTGTGFVLDDLIAVTGGGGSGAELIVTAVSGGKITNLGFNNIGSGYHKKATVASTSVGGGSGAEITLDGEEGPGGGNAKLRYITKSVNLAKGMDATGLKVFVTARQPAGTRIYVYYKVRSNLDGAVGGIESKNWNVMRQVLPDTGYSNESFVEFEFDTGGDDIVYDSLDSDGNRSTYDTFNMFKIKLVGHSASSVSVPVIQDVRAIAVT